MTVAELHDDDFKFRVGDRIDDAISEGVERFSEFGRETTEELRLVWEKEMSSLTDLLREADEFREAEKIEHIHRLRGGKCYCGYIPVLMDAVETRQIRKADWVAPKPDVKVRTERLRKRRENKLWNRIKRLFQDGIPPVGTVRELSPF